MITDISLVELCKVFLTRYTATTGTKYGYRSDLFTTLSTTAIGVNDATPSTLPPSPKG